MVVPLIFWEQTDVYKQEIVDANKRFGQILRVLDGKGFTCTYIGNLRMSNDGYPEVWLNSSGGFYRDLRANDALDVAKKRGDVGWWSLDTLEEFSRGEGMIVEEAMFRLGFRRHKKDCTKWVKREKEGLSPLSQSYRRYDAEKWKDLSAELGEQRKAMLLMPNEYAGMGKSFRLETGKRGLIHVSLEANPFVGNRAETLWMLGEQIAQRAHIANQQQGYKIEAENIRLGKDEKGVYINSKWDNSYNQVECVIPHVVPSGSIEKLLVDFAKKIGPSATA